MQVIPNEVDSIEWCLTVSAWSMIGLGILTLATLMLTTLKSAYGRYSESQPFEFLNELQIPAKTAWFWQEIPSFLVPLYYFPNSDVPNKLVLCLFLIHYAQRSLVYPCLIRGGKATPVVSFLMAFIFCLWNGWMQGSYHSIVAHYPPGYLTTIRAISGIAIFFLGMSVNLHSDHLLRNLRLQGDRGYQIPRGGLFEWVSGGNFLGEVVEWLGFAIVANSLPSTAFAFFTAANIGPRAIHHHRWYISNFPNYPVNRKALIPYVL